MNLEDKFNLFLESDDKEIRLERSSTNSILILKVNYNDKIDVLYGISKHPNQLFDLKSDLNYYGFYDRMRHKLYDAHNVIINYIQDREYYDPRNIKKDELYQELNLEVNKRIKGLINNDSEMFDYSNVEIEKLTDDDVFNEFVQGQTSETLQDSIIQYHTTKVADILDYLSDEKEFVEREARNFILNNTAGILCSLKKSAEKRKLLKEIEENHNHPFHKIKEIINSVQDKDYKTVNLTIYKEGIEQTFKFAALPLKYGKGYMSSYNIVKLDDRELFKENFGVNADLTHDDIVRITYGKNVIYEDSNYKNNTLEEDNVFAR